MISHPNRSKQSPTNFHIGFRMRNGKLYGRVIIDGVRRDVTSGLRSSSPVHNNSWYVEGVFADEIEAARAAHEYLNYRGPAWGIYQLGESSTELVFSEPRNLPADMTARCLVI